MTTLTMPTDFDRVECVELPDGAPGVGYVFWRGARYVGFSLSQEMSQDRLDQMALRVRRAFDRE